MDAEERGQAKACGQREWVHVTQLPVWQILVLPFRFFN